MRISNLAPVLALSFGALLSAQSGQQNASSIPAEWTSALQWRSIGPAAMSGRIVAFSVIEDQPRTYWVGTGAGGLLKTTNGGITFEHQFTHEGSYAIGDVCHAPSNPDIVWVGTGEQNPIRSLSYGDGVYKSVDGGKTWEHKGLRESFMIGRIAIHPRDPDIVYVGAQGRLYGPNEERGLYKTTDGGDTWEKIMHIDDETGVIDVKMHPRDPDTLLVVSYQRMRDAYDGGRLPMDAGPGAGIWKTTDGGKNFKRIKEGLPDNLTRSGLSYCYSNPDVVYAIIGQTRIGQTRQRGGGRRGEGPREGVQGDSKVGLYRSEDGGDSWDLVNNTLGASWDYYFYGKIYADPVDPQRVYFLNVRSQVSEDGGHSFRPFTGGGVHSDSHALWIDRGNPEHLLLGNDGGVYESWDRSTTWAHLNNNAIGTFYHVSVDNRPIYWVYGGLQDNGTWGGPNRTRGRGPVNADWARIGGGDGFVVFAHPDDPDLVFYESQNGNMSRRNLKTGESTRIRPATGDGPRPRFNWKTPMLLSHHDSKVFYCAGNKLYRSESLGDDLQEISPELTFTERGAATAIGEDRFDAKTLYVGCEDGALWVTRDGGENWEEVSSKLTGMPGPRWVATIETSRFTAGRVYAAFDAHRSDDDD
ncbi:MAG: WD40/YVTN/BNR-like repeat-containing protein, partial [Planctomycetota bacterium]